MIRLGVHATAVIDVQGSCTLPDTTVVEPGAVIYIGARGSLALGARNIIYPNSTIRIDQGWMTTGDDVSFGPGVQIYEPRAGLAIGDNCLIAGGVMICGVRHGFAETTRPMRQQPAEAAKIVIEDDVWLGMGAIVGPGVTVGRGSVIGAGSVVTRSIPPMSVAWGNPCRVRRERS